MKNFGVVIADDYEYNPYVESVKKYGSKETKRRNKESVEFVLGEKKIICVKCGIGKVNAASATAFLISDDNCEIIFNIGLSGAVSGHRRDDIVAGKSFRECDFDLTAINVPLGVKPQEKFVYEPDKKLFDLALSIPGVGKAVCGTGDLFLADKKKAEFYRETFGITTFDMETAAIASVCNDAGVKFLSLRQISDDADDVAGADYTESNNKQQKTLSDTLLQVIEKL